MNWAFAISRSHYTNINLGVLSLGYPDKYKDEGLDEHEAAVAPLSQDLADRIGDVVLPRRGRLAIRVCGQILGICKWTTISFPRFILNIRLSRSKILVLTRK